MRKLLVIALLVNAALLGVRCWQEYPGAVAGGGPVATDNGDFNGNGIGCVARDGCQLHGDAVQQTCIQEQREDDELLHDPLP